MRNESVRDRPREQPDAGHRAVGIQRLPTRVYVLGAVLLITGLVALTLMFTQSARGGLAYLFLYSLPANTAISIFPSEPILMHYGKFLSIWLAAGAVTLVTIIAGFLDHRVFVPVLNHEKISGYKGNRLYRSAARRFGRYPFATLAMTAFAPIPFFPFKFLSFSTSYPLLKYLAALTLGRFPKYVLIAWAGSVISVPTPLVLGVLVAGVTFFAVRSGPELWGKWKGSSRVFSHADAATLPAAASLAPEPE